MRVLRFLRDRYLCLDRRVLALFRIYYGIVLFCDVARRLPYVTFFYSNDGVLSNHFAIFAPLGNPYFTVFSALSTPAEAKVGFALALASFAMLTLGFKTRVAQILSLLFYSSINTRNIFLENGGTVVLVILGAWTVLLPLGDRFSIDAVVRSMRRGYEKTASEIQARAATARPKNAFFTIAALGIAAQIAAIYYFNVVHKSGHTWKEGQAIHLVLWQNRVATPFAALLRMHEPAWLSPLLCKMTLIIEGSAPVLVFAPVLQKYARTVSFVQTAMLHIGIALMMSLGPFSYGMIALNMLLLPSALMDGLGKRLARGKAPRTITVDESNPRAVTVARLLARLDTFELLTFVAGDSTRVEEILAATRSLPVGIAWRLLVGNGLGRALLARWLRGKPGAEWVREPPVALECEPPIGRRLFTATLREASIALLFAAVLVQLSIDCGGSIPIWLHVRQPELLAAITQYPRLRQGWRMFAPEAPEDDGTLVVDATTVDGRHIDILTGKPPDFDAPLHGPWYPGSLICDYSLRMSQPSGYQEELKKYLLNWQTIERRPHADRVVHVEVWWVRSVTPKIGETVPKDISKRLIFEASAK